MITPQQAELLRQYLLLVENEAFLLGEVHGKGLASTMEWTGPYQKLQSDVAEIHGFINSLTEQNV